MTSGIREELKRVLEIADDTELKQLHKRLMKSHPRNACFASSSVVTKWRPKYVEDACVTIQLLLDDVGLRVASKCAAVPPHEANMKVVGAEVVDRLRETKKRSGNPRATTVSLSLNVATIFARAVEMSNRILAYERPYGTGVIFKNQRGDAPLWASSARGSGCSFNDDGKLAFKKALRGLLLQVDECRSGLPPTPLSSNDGEVGPAGAVQTACV